VSPEPQLGDTHETRLVSAKEDRARVLAMARGIMSFATDWRIIEAIAEELVRTAQWRIEHPSEDRVTFTRTGPR
jgi:hypothetical protein